MRLPKISLRGGRAKKDCIGPVWVKHCDLDGQSQDLLPSQKQVRRVSSTLKENLHFLSNLLGDDKELVVGKFEISGSQEKAGIVYISSMVDKFMVNQHILTPLMLDSYRGKSRPKLRSRYRLDDIRSSLLTSMDLKETEQMPDVVEGVLKGNTVFFLDGAATALIIDTKGFKQRSISTPETEISVRGTKSGFVEDIVTNFSLLRRFLATPDLRYESFTLGRVSRTEVRLAWIEGIANPKIIEEARRRINRIDIDCVFGVGMIAELIEDTPSYIWPQYRLTERPDVLAANLAEGRFCIFCNGTPYVMLAPVFFSQDLQTVDDYAEKAIMGSFFRIVRQVAFWISLIGSGFYLSLVSYHPSLIPPTLAIRIAQGRHGVPFPTVVEMLLMTVIIDVLREAGVRLPKAVGAAVGILGAVIIGQAAVSAGFVSPAMIIVVAISAISNFAIPTTELANGVRLVNYVFIVLSGLMGIFGLTLGGICVLWRLMTQRSFGIPVFYPIAPRETYGLKDTLVRLPLWTLHRRPSLLAPENQIRVGDSLTEPGPANGGRTDNT